MIDNSGKQLGNYRLQKLLGHGGFADVYLGEHIYLHTQAAIKVIHTQVRSEDTESFRNEALLIAHLEHPNIIRVLDFGIQDTTPFLVMEYASGGTLRQRIPKGTRLAPVIFLPYVQQVAAALQYAHNEKIIHRDVKPENMLLSADERVKLSDFGIALIAGSTQSQQTEPNAIGTMWYMAPEQFQGKARPASDQYALAVVVYEWLTGEKPFKATSYIELISQHLISSPLPIDEQALGIPHTVTQVLWKALSKDPHERFARIQDFADALERAFSLNEPIPVQSLPQHTSLSQAKSPEHIVAVSQQQIYTSTTVAPEEKHAPSTAKKKGVVQQVAGCTRTFVLSLIVIGLLLCGLSVGGYSYLENRNPPSQADALARNFVAAIAHQNYDLAYTYLGSAITIGTSHDAFIHQAQNEDRCDGDIIKYQQTNTSYSGNTQIYDYNISRSKLSQYHLHVTVTKDFWGNWQLTDYNSDSKLCS